MEREPSRWTVMGGVGAAGVLAALARPTATAKDAPNDLAYHSASELVKLLTDRKVSSRELVDAEISRIEALDWKMNAVVVRDFERAQGGRRC